MRRSRKLFLNFPKFLWSTRPSHGCTKGPCSCLLGGILGLLAGCSGGGGRVPVPEMSPETASQQVLAEFDANHDGLLDAKELERCPALKGSLKLLDKDGDGRLSAGEIRDRLTFYQRTKIGLMSFPCQVFLDGTPLGGATVTFEPEAFLGSGMKPASGVSEANGGVLLTTEGENVDGIQCGFFRVKVSKRNSKGQETISARYNRQTILGQEVAPDLASGVTIFRLTSK